MKSPIQVKQESTIVSTSLVDDSNVLGATATSEAGLLLRVPARDVRGLPPENAVRSYAGAGSFLSPQQRTGRRYQVPNCFWDILSCLYDYPCRNFKSKYMFKQQLAYISKASLYMTIQALRRSIGILFPDRGTRWR